MSGDEIRIGECAIEIGGRGTVGELCDIRFTPAPADAPYLAEQLTFDTQHEAVIEGEFDVSVDDIRALVEQSPPGPRRIKMVVDGDEEKTMIGTVSEQGTLEASITDIRATVNKDTGDVRFVAVLTGGFEMPITREVFIEIAVAMATGTPDEVAALRQDLDAMLPKDGAQ